VGSLVGEFLDQGRTLLRAEVALARAEVKQEAKKAAKSGGLFAAAGLVALLGCMTAVAFLVIALAGVMPAWGAALLVSLGLFAAAAGLGFAARERFKAVSKPHQTIQTLKEDQQWAKQTMHAVRSQLHANA
jgi:hypothetical protein